MNVSEIKEINIKLLHVRNKSNVSKGKPLSKTFKIVTNRNCGSIKIRRIISISRFHSSVRSRNTIQRLRCYLPFNGEQRRKRKRYCIRLNPHFGKDIKVVRSYIPQLISRPWWRIIEWTDDITTNTRFIARSF